MASYDDNSLDAVMQQLIDAELIQAARATLAADALLKPEPNPTPPCSLGICEQTPAPLAPTLSEHLDEFTASVIEIAATVLKIPLDRIDPYENMARYGVDSILVTEIIKRIAELLDRPIAPTIFFEAKHLHELAEILYQRFQASVLKRYTATPTETTNATTETDPLDQEVQTWLDRFQTISSTGQTISVTPACNADVNSSRSSTTEASSHPQQNQTVSTQPHPHSEPSAHTETLYPPIAIIAMSGSFAQSQTLAEFEQHLRNGDDCMSEIPAERWDWRSVFGDPKTGEFSNVKYGGFIPSIDQFDPQFFGMSPREAELMDPQHRLFIECVWRLLETAGYAPESFSGKKVGLFLGINLQDYAHLIDRAGAIEALHLTSLGHMFCPNRISFLLNIHGPSQVIDTACSSSLVALHRAALSIQHEGCEYAIAGGANLMITPDMHIMYSKVGMICEDGRCKTFAKQANGYARGDGIGAVLLKPLAKAEADGDTILGVLRASAENHGGLSTSLTAPSPKAQAHLIVEAQRLAGIDPRTIGFIECHGTGTPLGDPIEINGLKMAFAEQMQRVGVTFNGQAFCGLGSVKSNIGHAETAAGIAGVIKTVLSLQHKRLYASLHCEELNPLLELEQSPFYILQQGRDWDRPVIDGVDYPRRAGVSSFGAGGSNAHVIIEEYSAEPLPVTHDGEHIIVLSAKTRTALTEQIKQLYEYLTQTKPAIRLVDLAYTLQIGRSEFTYRWASVVNSLEQLSHTLNASLTDNTAGYAIFQGQRPKTSPPDTLLTLMPPDSPEYLTSLAQRWVQGFPVAWQALCGDISPKPRRIALPTYPFNHKRYWLPDLSLSHNRHAPNPTSWLHPLLQQNTSRVGELRFSSQFSGNEAFFTDHVIANSKLLPGVAYLEMARAAYTLAVNHNRPMPVRIKNTVWISPYRYEANTAPLHISLFTDRENSLRFQVYSENSADTERVLHSQGIITTLTPGNSAVIDLASLISGFDTTPLSKSACYQVFQALGLSYGATHQSIDWLYYRQGDAPDVLAKLSLPSAIPKDLSGFYWHPGVFDGVLQTTLGMLFATGQLNPEQDLTTLTELPASLPFALTELDILAPMPNDLWVWLRMTPGHDAKAQVQKFDIDAIDEQGQVCLRLRGFSSRVLANNTDTSVNQPAMLANEHSPQVLLCAPEWQTVALKQLATPPTLTRHVVLLLGFEHDLTLNGLTNSATLKQLKSAADSPAQAYLAYALDVFSSIKTLMSDDQPGTYLLQLIIDESKSPSLYRGLSGLLLSAAREYPKLHCQLISLTQTLSTSNLTALITQTQAHLEYTQLQFDGQSYQALTWQPTTMSQCVPASYKTGGVYLITGGAGGLGLLLAEAIAKAVQPVTIVLLGRSPLAHAQQDKLTAIAQTGAKLIYRQADLSDVTALADAIADIKLLNGILHCAGVLHDNFIARKTEAEFDAVFAPKVLGTLNLDLATATYDLDFFVVFSSVASALGSAGQADYAAANGFLDAYAGYRQRLVNNGQRQGKSLAINWPLWQDGGMQMPKAAVKLMQANTGMQPLPTPAGLSALSTLLNQPDWLYLVLFGDAERIRSQLLSPAPTAHPQALMTINSPEPTNSLLTDKLSSLLLAQIATMMKFELADLDSDTDISDYGYDSISFTELANQLNQRYQLDLAPTVFFEHTSVRQLAQYLSQHYSERLSTQLGITPSQPVSPPQPVLPPKAKPVINSVHSDKPHVNAATAADIAIIGMSGRFPMAQDLDEFWQNLYQGRDCISEIPASRWDWREYYGDPKTEPNKSNAKWGGFIDGVEQFDAEFFGISPREARIMDPQQRLLMEYVWLALEDAGYSAQALAGSQTALFIATASSGYGDLMAKNHVDIDGYSATGVVGSVGPNRMSYFLDLHGPSEPIETACSSSLVAIHRAVLALKQGDCDLAIVGGINLILTPETHISFNKAGMLSPDGRCKTFSEQANGYVRGEGVGMLVLKKLTDAETAGDPIYAVIKSSAENHGGRANSLTAPNPKAQTALLKDAYQRAEVSIDSISYIEAHGTGTELGDPIEVSALKSAFSELTRSSLENRNGYCGLGSVKTNIGHLELAAGVAGVIKVLLQIKHKTLVKTLHAEPVNPYIRLTDTPFYLVTENRPWLPDLNHPRRAGISSFGFGGVNAHIVLEDYPDATPTPDDGQDIVFVLSAKSEASLKAYAQRWLGFIQQQQLSTNETVGTDSNTHLIETLKQCVAELLQVDTTDIALTDNFAELGLDNVQKNLLRTRLEEALAQSLSAYLFDKTNTLAELLNVLAPEPLHATQSPPSLSLIDMAYTLQIGRASLDYRLGFYARSLTDIADKLTRYINSESVTGSGIYTGYAKANKELLATFTSDDELQEAIQKWLLRKKFDQLLNLWSKGLNIDWQLLYPTHKPNRVRVPTYPFVRDSYWFSSNHIKLPPVISQTKLHELLHENVSTLKRHSYKTVFTGQESFLRDHRINGQAILPGVVYPQMALTALNLALADQANSQGIVQFSNITWLTPYSATTNPEPLFTEIQNVISGGFGYSISSKTSEPIIHSQGRIKLLTETPAIEPVPLETLISQAQHELPGAACYQRFNDSGMVYGASHQAITTLYLSQDWVLARLQANPNDAKTWQLPHGLLDSALQAGIGFAFMANTTSGAAALPFALTELTLFKPCPEQAWAWLRYQPASVNAKIKQLDIDICDNHGVVCIRLRGLLARSPDKTKADITAIKPAPVNQPASSLQQQAQQWLINLLAATIKQTPERIKADAPLEKYGIDSIMIVELTRILEGYFGTLSKTLFFEYQTLAELTDYLLSQHRARFQALLNTPPSLPRLKPVDKTQALSTLPQPTPIPANTPPSSCLDIAIIGLAGRYPKALDIDEYWQNLRTGRDCISEIPPERWAWQNYYNADRNQHHGHYSKWGGFIDGVDQFDALFFNISPREAEAIDPQERLFLQHAWLALEDAGLTPTDLQQLVNSQQPELPAQVGVYAGVMYSEYQLLSLNQPDTVASASYASIANRVSYFLNLHGPSLTVDTMCSSSLTAIHLACQDLAQGRTDLALAGGVNVSVHPNKYSMLSRGQFISSLGQCQSFGVGGDGYIPGEGVGVVVLKRLADAERDGDNIYGVIKGSALNHGGKTNGYSVPNPKAQTAVIRQAMRQAQVKADAISYIEAHGTGTALGDPIEITGLTKAFQQDGVTNSCRIGSAKSNIGHCESAAGIAGLTKVLLQLKHHEIAPSLHAETLNPNIDFAATPFIVNQQLTAWEKPVVNGATLPRIAGLSSFGAGGANAHIIIAEYEAEQAAVPLSVATPQLIVLSANTAAQRAAYAQNLLIWLDNNANNTALTLTNLAYSLSTGRMAMPKRLAIIAQDLTSLRQQLRDFLAQPEQHQPALGIYLGVDHDIETVAHEQLNTWFNTNELALLADYWRQGGVIAWRELYSSKRLTRLNVPTYPFANERHWLSITQSTPDNTSMLSEHGLLLLTPLWQAIELNNASPVQTYSARLFVTVGITVDLADSIELSSDNTDLAESYQQTLLVLSTQLKTLLKQNPNGQLLCQVLIPGLGYPEPLQIFAGLAGFLATVAQENPRLTTQLIALEKNANAQQIVPLLAQHAASGFTRYQNSQYLRQTWQEAALNPSTAIQWRQSGVYLITGGAGGLGLIIAEAIAKQCPDVVLLLTGRRSLNHDDTCFKALADLGVHFEYHRLDVADSSAINAFITELKQRYPTINGIIHAAGITHDQLFISKSEQTLLTVLAPKVQGLVSLDLATRGLDLDWLVLFSSVAAFGNPGQADYAAANGFMDAYCHYRNQLSQDSSLTGEQKPYGLTLTINWPLWADGGMSVPETVKRQMWTHAGITPLSTELGLQAFNQIVASALTQTLVLAGDLKRLRADLLTPTQPKPASQTSIKPSTETLEIQLIGYLKKLLSELLKLPAHQIDEHSPLESYGVNSVVALSLTNELENHLGSLPKTLFFEYPSLAQVSAYLANNYRQALQENLGLIDGTADQPTLATSTEPEPVKPEQTHRDIAIIGLGGHLPNADTLEQFWQHLVNGESSITEIPATRWDWQALADTAHTRCHWGSFINNVAAFDPLFFNITPKDAPYIDPMERLFLETVWQVLESSGQLGERLSHCYQQQVGVFVGAMYQHYRDWLTDSELPSSLLSSFSAIANRVSYFFNFQGPSVAVDTMCSSTGIALHMACTSLLNGEIKLAIVGGVNLSLHPNKYQGLNQTQLAASRADSISFADGDGYIPAEAVGAIVLKPLTAALADGDEVLAVIKATAVNHAGQGSGFATPNPAAQAELIQACLDKAQVTADSITYVEAAANGMALADALEFSALRKVFANTTTPCALGSVKALLGHAEAASGFTQLAKTVLQLQHQHITPIPEPTRTNPAIELTDTRFYWPRQSSPWPSNGAEPRRVLINSFGAGGSNACIIVEEFIKPEITTPSDEHLPSLCLFSAKTQTQLMAVIQQLVAYLQHTEVNLADLAYTLQTARQHMTLRLAIIASTQDDLLTQLHAYLSGQTDTLLIGDMNTDTTTIKQRVAGHDGMEQLAQAFQQHDWSTLAYYWVSGVTLPWLSYYRAEPRGLLTSLPTYPFTTEQYWLSRPEQQPSSMLTAGYRIAYPAKWARRLKAAKKSRLHSHAKRGNEVNTPDIEATASTTDIHQFLTSYLTSELLIPAEQIQPTKPLQDYGIHSIAAVQLLNAVSGFIGVAIPGRALLEHPTLNALADYIEGLLHNASEAEQPHVNETHDIEQTVEQAPVDNLATRQPLSEGQKGLWLLQKMQPESSAYNVPIAFCWRQPIDVAVLAQCYQYLLATFPILTTRIIEDQGELYQITRDPGLSAFTHEHADELSEAQLQQRLQTLSKQTFNLEQESLFRMTVWTSRQQPTTVLLVLHHIITDGRSSALLLSALVSAYHAFINNELPQRLQQPVSRYYDFVNAQQQMLNTAEGQAHLAYWQQQLSELPRLDLAYDYPATSSKTSIGQSVHSSVPPLLTRQLKALANEYKTSLSDVLLSAFFVLLFRYTGQTDIGLGMPTLGRRDKRYDEVLGYFVNMMVVRAQLNPQQTFSELVKALQLTVIDGLDHAEYPFPALVRGLAEPTPLYQVAFAYQNFAPGHDNGWLPELEFNQDIRQEGADALGLEIYEQAGGLQLSMDFAANIFNESTVLALLKHYTILLAELVKNPERPISSYDLLAQAEQRLILNEWNHTPKPSDLNLTEQTLPELFQQQAKLTPKRIALIAGKHSVSYKDLHQAVRQLTRQLLKLTVKPGDVVAVSLNRSPEAVISLLAVFQADAIYLPIDPDLPAARIEVMLNRAGARLLITDSRIDTANGLTMPIETLYIDLLRTSINTDLFKSPPLVHPEHTAYLLYTSGSTGEPKAVAVSHAALSQHCQTVKHAYQLTEQDRILHFAPFSVDASLEQLLPGLITGATIILRDEDLGSAQQFLQQLNMLNISVLDIPPAFWHELLSTSQPPTLPKLRLIITGGEALKRDTYQRWRRSPYANIRWLNAYGPTETTITSTLYQLGDTLDERDAKPFLPIGRPLPGETVYILDAYGNPVPPGVAGELHIGGHSLALGYWQQPELTAEKFITHRSSEHGLLYKTGDLAHWRQDGVIVYLGRTDHQVKLRGYRIECAEIEARLSQHPSITESAVLLDTTNQLSAYCVVKPGFSLNSAELTTFLAETLPDYMLPANFIAVTEIARTRSGKVNRQTLSQRAAKPQESSVFIAPQTAMEQRIAAIWQDILNLPQISLYDDFFDLGGHSLLAVRLLTALQQAFGIELSLSKLLQTPTISAMAKKLDALKSVAWTPIVSLQNQGQQNPIFCLHAAGGHVLAYRKLAMQLGKQQPVYGLESPGVNNQALPTSFEQLASFHLTAIRQQQPQGPYHLLGWSLGGVLAYEIARQLQNLGETVAVLALIDAHTPKALQLLDADINQLLTAQADPELVLLHHFAKELNVNLSLERWQNIILSDDRIDCFIEQIKSKDSPLQVLSKSKLMQQFNIYQAHCQLLNAYQAKPYAGNVVLFGNERHLDSNWLELITGNVSIVNINADHYAMMSAGNTAIIASQLNAITHNQ